jgi:SAM-dependent methyltransferase
MSSLEYLDDLATDSACQSLECAPVSNASRMSLPSLYPSTESLFRKRTTKREHLAQIALRDEMQALVDTTDAPFFEVAGPTPRGFSSLHGVVLPHGLAISNIHRSEGVNLLADVRQLPLANKSISGLLVSCLNRLADGAGGDPLTGYFDIMAINGIRKTLDELHEDTASGDYERWHDQSLHNRALRIALLSEARRVLRPGGLLIMRGTQELELGLAHHLGFDYKLGMSSFEDLPFKAWPHHDEHVLRLNRMETGAGIAIESRSF